MVDVKIDKKDVCCPVCGAKDIFGFLNINGMPIYCNVLWPSYEEAIGAPKGDICLALCEICGHIFNYCFDPGLMDYGQNYENSLHFSPVFQNYAKSLAKKLIQKHNLYDKNVIEIGCGKGDFLKLLCEEGNNFGYGFDKSYQLDRHNLTDNRVKFIPDFYNNRYSDIDADFICCRHVLEHIQNPVDFLKMVRESSEPKRSVVFFFEVPNVMFIVRDLSVWDIIYEHCGYFSKNSLCRAFLAAGYEVLDTYEAFENQFLAIEATTSFGGNDSTNYDDQLAPSRNEIARFVDSHNDRLKLWNENFERFGRAGKKVVIWGGGSKGVSVLNFLGDANVKYIVDINPYKTGKFIPGTGQKVVNPQFLTDYEPNVVVVMNQIYLEEIRKMMWEMGLKCELIVM